MLKKIILMIFLLLSVSQFTLQVTEARSSRSSSSDTYVKGYYKKNGTYVAPYYRSAPDGIKSNNYECIDYGRNC